MALDSNPRRFYLHVTEIDASLKPSDTDDELVIVCHGKLLPTTKRRLLNAILEGNAGIEEQTLA